MIDFIKNTAADGGEADFVLRVPSYRPVRILQVTDTQIIDSSQCRYDGRLSPEEMLKWQPQKVYERMGYYLDGAVEKAKPDLIVHTGDFVYGEFDDSGDMLDKHIGIMESYGLPWTLALGNHERETAIGTAEIIKRLENAPHCMFKGAKHFGGERLEGDGSFSVLLEAGGKPLAVLYVLDSGCGTEERPCGIYKTQRAWIRAVAERYKGVTAYAFFHVGMLAATRAAEKYGYDPENFKPFEIVSDSGDYGYWGSRVRDCHCIDADGSLMELFRETGVKGAFMGHFHELSASIFTGGVRLTYGLKTGEYDSHLSDRLGGTLVTLPTDAPEGFSSEHIVIRKR